MSNENTDTKRTHNFDTWHQYRRNRKEHFLAFMEQPMTKLVMSGMGIARITRWLNENHFRTITGKAFTPATTWRLINDLGLRTKYASALNKSPCMNTSHSEMNRGGK